MALPFLPYREPEIIHSCSELGGVLRKETVASRLAVTDKGMIGNGLIKPLGKVLQATDARFMYPKRTVIQLGGRLE